MTTQPAPSNPLMGRFNPARGVFVTATDTEVGKTALCGALATILRSAGRRVGVFKPAVTGGSYVPTEGVFADDTMFLAWAADTDWDLEAISPASYTLPAAPLVAARQAGRPVDFDRIVQCYNNIAARSDFVIVEGVGGLLVPLTEQISVLDLAAAMGLPVLIVARAGLGTINHSLLTVRVARSGGLDVRGVVINRYDWSQTDPVRDFNAPLINELTGLPVPILPEDPGVSVDGRKPGIGQDFMEMVAQEVLPLIEDV